MTASWLFAGCSDQIRTKYPNKPEDMASVFRYAATLSHTLREKGVFNMLLTDGVFVLAYCTNNLHYITRRAPFGKATLIDADMVVDFNEETTPNDIVSVIATKPLTNDERWKKMQPGEFVLFKMGELI